MRSTVMDEDIETSRERLPIFRAKQEILNAFAKNKTLIFVGETGCGKTTQIPQYLLEAGYAKHKCIAVTQVQRWSTKLVQGTSGMNYGDRTLTCIHSKREHEGTLFKFIKPRRVAATTIAKRVAQEVKTELGSTVGFSIRFENMTSPATKIKFVTDGMLVREATGDKLLLEYSVVILDEAHERTLFNDLLLGVTKNAQRVRLERNLMPLMIIVMSATLEAQHIANYFDNAPAYSISGRDYSISILNSSKPQPNYVRSALVTVFQIHQNEEEGDILVFCTGQEEIDSLVSETRDTAKCLPAGYGQVHVCGLYSALPFDQQTDVFNPAPVGTRKIIFATNIAETSITIPNIKYVVDTGLVKAKSFDAKSGFDILRPKKISKAQAEQRAGRAGREFDGFCYRLYTKEEYNNFKDQTEPEILRSNLSNVVLQMVSLGFNNITEFDFIDQPSDQNIEAAVDTLKALEAIVEKNGKLELTPCGNQMKIFPLDPKFSKMINTSTKYKCTDEILTIISLLSVDSVFYTKQSDKENFDLVRKKFEAAEGDHIMLLNVYKQFKKFKGHLEWCKENYINFRNVRKAIKIRKQLSALCAQLGIAPCSTPCTLQIRRCLASGLFRNIALLQSSKVYKLVENNQIVKIHPSSSLFKAKNLPSCVMFTELVQTSEVYMRNVTYIQEELLVGVCENYFKNKPGRLANMKPIAFVSAF